MSAVNNSIISEYLAAHSVYHSIREDGSCNAIMRIDDSGRFNLCEVTLRCGDVIEATMNMPLRCMREEHSLVIKEITRINDELSANECIELDGITGDIRFRRIFDKPSTPEEFASSMFACDTLVREYADRIMQTVSDARNSLLDAAARRQRKQKAEERYKSSSALTRFIISIGLIPDPRLAAD